MIHEVWAFGNTVYRKCPMALTINDINLGFTTQWVLRLYTQYFPLTPVGVTTVYSVLSPYTSGCYDCILSTFPQHLWINHTHITQVGFEPTVSQFWTSVLPTRQSMKRSRWQTIDVLLILLHPSLPLTTAFFIHMLVYFQHKIFKAHQNGHS